MNQSKSDSYAAAGVDITAGYRAVELMKRHIGRTVTPGVVGDVGGFGGLFCPDLTGIRSPVLVSGTDGVGTKLKLAFLLDRHDTVGIDCVAMCVNDIVCCGARPLFFLDYIACGKNLPERIERIVAGVAEGCVQAGAALIGGETAEMPGFYPEDEYDLAGFAVGLADRERLPDKQRACEGDVLIALPSSGLHSNGFSLTPSAIYVKPVLALFEAVEVKSVCHITGGGFFENIPRGLPSTLAAKIDKAGLVTPPIFPLLQKEGNIPERDMFNTFNMGVGMTVVVARQQADRALEVLRAQGVAAYVAGELVKGDGGVILC